MTGRYEKPWKNSGQRIANPAPAPQVAGSFDDNGLYNQMFEPRSNNPLDSEMTREFESRYGSPGGINDQAIVEEIERRAKPYKKKAEDRYKMWHTREPDQDIYAAFKWPTKQIVIGQATAIGYRSDKWYKVGQTKDYIHHFDRPYPRLIIQKPSRFTENDRWMKKIKPVSSNKRVKPPKGNAFVPLGYCLDIEFIGPDGMMRNYDYTQSAEMPMLAVDHARNILMVVQEKGSQYVLLLDSPIVEITPRGIEN